MGSIGQPSVRAALLKGYAALVNLANAVTEHENTMTRHEGNVCVPHTGYGPLCIEGVVYAPPVLVDEHYLAATEGGALVQAVRNPMHVRPYGCPAGMVMDGHGHISSSMEGKV
jgi:hypothetical protein